MSVDQINAGVAGVESVYRELFGAHFAGLLRLAALLGADDPEDVAQEAFVRLHRRRALIRDHQAALAYLRRTVVNQTNSHLRHLRVIRRHTPALAASLHDTASAESTVIEHDEQHRLVAAVLELPERQRNAIVLRYWLDLSVAEIAETLQMRAGTVKSTLHRAAQALRIPMEESR